LFGNLFDNALYACGSVKDRKWIEVTFSDLNDLAYISVSNSKGNDIMMEGNDFLSTRRHYAAKGVGLGVIRTIAKRYGGDAKVLYTSDKFSVTIWMNRQI
jgi:sensor histidine kinase regulating citrate/malate metabolism